MTFQTRALFTVGTFAGGTALHYYNADPFFPQLGSTNATFTLNTAWLPGNPGSLSTFAAKLRVVSSGVVIRCIAPALSAQGSVVVTRQSQAAPLGSAVSPGGLSGTDVTVYPISAGLEIAFLFKSLSAASRDMAAPSTNVVQTIGLAWDVVKIEIIGGPGSSSMLSVEHVVNCEFSLPDSQESLTQLSPTSAPFSRGLCDLSDTVTGSLTRAATTTLASFASMAAKKAAAAIGSYFGGPAGGAAAYSLTDRMLALTVD